MYIYMCVYKYIYICIYIILMYTHIFLLISQIECAALSHNPKPEGRARTQRSWRLKGPDRFE